MNWTMTRACGDCPFRKDRKFPLRKSRIREISHAMLDSQGGTFPCHKTVDYSADDGEPELNGKEVHCAGALAYALKQGPLPQLARIMNRLGAFDAEKVQAESGELVWDSLKQWMESIKA